MTTLVNILFRMLSGPFDIPNIAAGRELGNRRLDAIEQQKGERSIFAMRVNDDAADATASLLYALGGVSIRVTRKLKDLSLVALQVEGDDILPCPRASTRSSSAGIAKLARFGDWILVLRHLVFYFEDRRALVWDASAQRELLRLLFLSTDDTREWTTRTRDILERDSLVRNLSYAFRKEQRALAKLESSVNSADEVRQQLLVVRRSRDAAWLRTDQTSIKCHVKPARNCHARKSTPDICRSAPFGAGQNESGAGASPKEA